MSDRILEFDIAVIGAGVAGLLCAQQLRFLGDSVVVLEKSRGVGGRVATRRLYDTQADFGVPFLDPRGPISQSLIPVLCRQGILEPWTDTVYRVGEKDSLLTAAAPRSSPYYMAPGGINHLGKFLAQNLEIWRRRRVQALTPTAEGNWHLALEAMGESGTETPPMAVQAKAVVLAIPAPQAVMLLESRDTGLPSTFCDRLREVEFDPCISVMAGYPASRQRELVQSEYRARVLEFPPTSPLGRLFWQSSKGPTAPQPVFVLHSRPGFAEQHLETQDLEAVGRELCQEAGKWGIPGLDAPEWIQVHRWRYAVCRRPLAEPLLKATVPLPIVCAGDGCGSRQLETALQSGLAAAAWISDRRGHLPMPPLASLWEAIARGNITKADP
jgi:renalase